MPFRIKICGVRTVQDVQWVGDSAADAVGINFHPSSVRFVPPDDDEKLSAAAHQAGLVRVGIFVEHSIVEIEEIAARVELDVVQLHGDQDIDFAEALMPRLRRPIVRAIKLPTMEMNEVAIDTAVMGWVDAGCSVLLDADAGGQHGGSGQPLDWSSIGLWNDHRNVPFALAGGIDDQNVGKAIRKSGAFAVDAASGIESVRGRKDADRIAAFADAAALALGQHAGDA